MPSRLVLVPALLSAAVAGPALATGTIYRPAYTVFGGADELFGQRIVRAGDVDADGLADFAIYAVDATDTTGRVTVHSAADGAVLHTFVTGINHPFIGTPIGGAGDVDGDGHDDLIVGDASANRAVVHSGANGRVLHTFVGDDPDDQFGLAVNGAGDVNGDGRPDVIVGAPQLLAENGAGSVHVFSGADGTVLHTITSEDVGDQFGVSVGSAGDLDGDGRAEFHVGAIGDGESYLHPGFPPFVPPFITDDNTGALRVFDGATGAEIITAYGDLEENGFGFSTASAGDVDFDGVPDVIGGTGVQDAGHPSFARVLSGADGSILLTFSPLENDRIDVSALGDIDGDGHADVLVAGRDARPGQPDLTVRSGADGTILFAWDPVPPLDLAPNALRVVGLGDLNGDGRADFALAAAQPVVGGGYARVFLSDDAAALDLDGSGTIDFGDLVAMIAAWGPCDGACPADIDGDGTVGQSDLLLVLVAWGAAG